MWWYCAAMWVLAYRYFDYSCQGTISAIECYHGALKQPDHYSDRKRLVGDCLDWLLNNLLIVNEGDTASSTAISVRDM